MKTKLNNVQVDLREIAMIGELRRELGKWVFPVMWKGTNVTTNMLAWQSEEEYSLSVDHAESEARKNFDDFVASWREV